MRYSTKYNEAEARQRLHAFWAGESLGRPALHVIVRNPVYQQLSWSEPALSPKDLDLTPEWQTWLVEDHARFVLHFAEKMPGYQMDWGSCLTTLATLAGGDYEYHDSAWILEILDIYARELPVFTPEHPIAQRMTRCYTALKAAIGDRGFINPPLMCDGLTTLSQFRTPEHLCVDLVEYPEMVRGWCDALTSLYIDTYEYYYQFLGYGESMCFGGPMTEGRTECVQCDFAVMLSPTMFEEFVMPDLSRVTNYFDRSMYHLDGTCQLRFLDQLASLPKLHGIQWNPVVTAGSPVGWLDAFRDIRARHLNLFISCSVDDAIRITQELGPDGLYLVLPWFDTPEEAEAAINAIEQVC